MTSSIRKTGRHSKSNISRSAGRPETPKIDLIATKAWFNALKEESGAENAYQIAKKYDAYLNTVAISGSKERPPPTLASKRFEKYAKGDVRPNVDTLVHVDKMLAVQGQSSVRTVFDDGPDGAPLWDALSGDFDALWKLIDKAVPEMPKLRVLLTSHTGRVNEHINLMFPGIEVDVEAAIHFSPASLPLTGDVRLDALASQLVEYENAHINQLREIEFKRRRLMADHIERMATTQSKTKFLYDQEEKRQIRFDEEINRRVISLQRAILPGTTIRAEWKRQFRKRLTDPSMKTEITFDQLASTIALWRLSMIVSDSVNRLDDLMTALIEDSIPNMLEVYGVADPVIKVLEDTRKVYRSWLYP